MILENITILIQKVWRGYRSRKFLTGLSKSWIEKKLKEKNFPLIDNEIIIEDDEDQLESNNQTLQKYYKNNLKKYEHIENSIKNQNNFSFEKLCLIIFYFYYFLINFSFLI